MLEIKDLSIWMRDTGRPLIEHLHFVLGPTDRAVIIGEEGNGKSSLLKTIVDPSLVEDYCEYSGKVLKNGMLVGYLEQDTPPEILEMTPAEFLDGPALLDGSLSGWQPASAAGGAALCRPADRNALRRRKGQAADDPPAGRRTGRVAAGRAYQRH